MNTAKEKQPKNLIYTVSNAYDPLDTFEVEATSYVKALEAALSEAGWCIDDGHEPEDDEEIEEKI